MLIGIASTLAQFYWRPARKVKLVQLIFNLSQVTVSSSVAYGAYKLVVVYVLHAPGPLALLVAAITHFGCNTAAMSTIIGLTESKPVHRVWKDSYLWSFPYYMVGAAAAGLVNFLNRTHRMAIVASNPSTDLPDVPLLSSLPRQTGNREEHAEQVSSLHLRTIEALALAIEAKDETTGEHLQRVRVYAMELAKELGLSEDETEALRAASVLHELESSRFPSTSFRNPES